MSEDLKPCPFCGGEAVLEMDEVGLNLVRCQECNIETAPEYRPDQALAAWDAMRGGALKPCPFCGEYAHMVTKKTILTADGKYGYSDASYSVECHSCLAETAPYRLLDEAVAAWNRRPDDA